MSNYRAAPQERADVTVRPDGIDEMVIGTLSSRQGHETSFAQLLDEWLGMRPDCVRLVTGDTRPRGDRRRLAFGTLAAPRQPNCSPSLG